MRIWGGLIVALALSGGVVVGQTKPAATTAAVTTAPADRVEPVKLALEHEGELSGRVLTVLGKQAQFLRSKLKAWDKAPSAKLLTDGRSIEAGIRPNAHSAYGLAVLYRCTGDESARDDALALLRFLLPTHGAGPVVCSDGHKWRNQWQSALWAASAGKAAWLLWDELDPQLRALTLAMVQSEADRFVGVVPPTQVERDTKAEENAWNAQIIALAFNMFPDHPRREVWRETAIRWQLSAFATATDVKRADVVDGRPLNQWLTGPNLHDDYTLENHDRVHPDYSSSIRTTLSDELVYAWAGNAPPAALRFNATQIYGFLKKMTLPDGGFVYPNAQDWHLHRNADWFDVHMLMAVMFDDRQAARLARICLTTAEKMQSRSDAGGIYAEGETAFASSQAMLLELYADAYLMLRSKGEGAAPMSEEQLWKELSGPHVFEAGKFAVIRTDHSVATFSWGRQVMGLVFPLRQDLLLTPNDRGLIGSMEFVGVEKESPRVKAVRFGDRAGGFEISGLLDRGNGSAEQRFAFVALPDGRVVYADDIRLVGDAKITRMNLGLLGVLNDKNWVYHDGERSLRSFDSTATLRSDNESAGAFTQSSGWYDLDGLGVVLLRSSGRQRFEAKPTRARGRTEQLFVLNDADRLPTGSVVVFHPGQTVERTQAAAGKCRIVATPDPLRFSVELEDGAIMPVDLTGLR